MIFTKTKKVFKINDIDLDKILVSKKEPYGTNKSIKYFIAYNDDDIIRPLCIKLPQMNAWIAVRQYPARLLTISYLKSTIKYGEKLKIY